MRKLLMAATAVVGAMGLAAAAHAQAPASGLMSGLGGDPAIFGPTSSVPGPTGLPGSIQAYFRGRVVTEWMLGGDSLKNRGGNKSGNIYFGEYARLYTGFAGTAANGLKFGAFLEVRQNGNSSLGESTGNATLIFRREVAYFKGNWGELRFGQTDGAEGLFMTGTFENFASGGLNGDIPSAMSGNAVAAWPFPENSGTYGTGKVVYLSPQFSGFDFGVDYEPNWNGTGGANCSSGLAGAGCPMASTITSPGLYRRNTIDAVGRYQGKLGPVALTATAGIITGGRVHSATAASNPTLFESGVTVAVGGLAVGGNFIMGNSNGGSYAADVPLMKGAPHEQAFVVGASYAMGPFIVGANYLNYTYASNWNGSTITNTAHDNGIDVGGSYAWAPGMTAFVEGLYSHRHQVGYDFVTGSAGTASNNASAFGMLIGNVFNW